MSRLAKIHLGPVMPGWGSWEWLGQEMIPEFQRYAAVSTFSYQQEPPRDGIVIVIKHPPPPEWLQTVQASQVPMIYSPVDFYDSVNAIDADAAWLTQAAHIIIHCHRLLPCFAPYAPVTYVDHQVRFITHEIILPMSHGPILWTGVHSNLPPLIAWLQQHPLSRPLCVLTNLEPIDPVELGFPQNQAITLERWTPDRHRAILHEVSAALDIKGDDFRNRHKPPTKALDFLATGLPLAVQRNSSSAEYLLQLGFHVADPMDVVHWQSPHYLAECQKFARVLRSILSPSCIAEKWWHLIQPLLK